MKKHSTRRRFGILTAVSALACCLAAASVLTACKEGETAAQAGEEAGVYYYDAGNEEYLLTLGGADKTCTFTLAIRDEAVQGTYTVDKEDIVLAGDGVTYSAELKGTMLILTDEDDHEMSFYKKVYYTVTFSEGGSQTVQTLNGKAAPLPADPQKAGQVFIGWYKDAAFKAPYLNEPITQNTTLYARWATPSETEYTVSFDLGYAEGTAPAAVQTVGNKLYSVPDVQRNGYTFAGWYVSMENKADRLSYAYTADTVFDADTTLFAVWQENGAQPAPAVSVSATDVTWSAVQGANSYRVRITAPDGSEAATQTVTAPVFTNVPFDDAGVYTVVVTALNAGGTELSEATRYYVHNGLARVSDIRVLETSVLTFRGVENAEKYLITVDCGDEAHVHTQYDNGTSLYFNFSNCAMQRGGIRFTIEAVADGYATSAATFVYERHLGALQALAEEDGILTWNAVAGATHYLVEVNNEDAVPVFGTQFSLKDRAAGEYTVSVTPVARGYNSPDAESITVQKTTPPLPAELLLNDMQLSWTAEDGIDYFVVYDGKETEAQKGTFDLTSLLSDWATEGDYTVFLKAVSGTSETLSEPFTFRYQALDPVLSYEDGILSWKPVAGATQYEVLVNGTSAATIGNGASECEIALTKAGENTVTVRASLESTTPETSITVTAHAVTLDVRGGGALDTNVFYKAVGDSMELPSPAAPEGHEFAGWYTTPNGPKANGAKYEDAFFVSAGELVLYAYYKPQSYTVTFGNAQLEAVPVSYGEDYTLPVPAAADATTAFGGWYSAQYGAGTQYTDADGKSVSPWALTQGATLYAYWVEGVLSYRWSNGGYVVSAGARIGELTSVTVPAKHNDGRAITQVESGAFKGCTTLTEINLPDTMTTIPANAFEGCKQLTSINIYAADNPDVPKFSSEDGVLYEGNAIRVVPAAKTGTYRIPDGVKSIPAEAFAGSGIERVIIPDSVTEIGREAFADCENLAEVTFENAASAGGSLTVGARAFMNTALTSITFPARLSESSFLKYDPALVNQNFDSPADLTATAADPFMGCEDFSAINIAGSNKTYRSVDGVLFRGNTLIYFPAYKHVSDYTIPATVGAIGAGAFMNVNFDSDDAIVLPAPVAVGDFAFAGGSFGSVTFTSLTGSAFGETTVGSYAFYQCESLRVINFTTDDDDDEQESCVTTIGKAAFKDCAAFYSLAIPASVTEIGDEAFANCATDHEGWSKLEITDGNLPLELGNAVFSGTEMYYSSMEFQIPARATLADGFFSGFDVSKITVASGHQTLGSDTDGNLYRKDGSGALATLLRYQSDKTSFTIPTSVTTIAANAFTGSNITSVTIPASVTEIGEEAFADTSLSSVTFTEGNTPLIIGARAFMNTEIATITLPARLTELGENAFVHTDSWGDIESNSTLTSVTFEENSSLTTIGDYAFARTGLSSVTIPASVTSIGDYAFYYTQSLTRVTFEKNSSLTAIGDHAFYYSALKTIALPESSVTIGSYAFANITEYSEKCTTSINLGGTTVIGDHAFYQTGSPSLTVEIPASVTEIGASAFEGGYSSTSKYLSAVTFEENSSLTTIGESAFTNSAITTINIPASVTSIGASAFSGSALESVTFTDGDGTLTIGRGAFNNTQITTVTLPKQFANFSADIFSTGSDGSVLNTINVSQDNPHYAVYEGILYTKDYSELLFCPPEFNGNSGSVTVHNNAKTIAARAFYECGDITQINFGTAQLTSVGDEAFRSTGLTSIELPDSVQTIGGMAFINAEQLTSFRVPQNLVSFDTSALGLDYLTTLTASEGGRYKVDRNAALLLTEGEEATLIYFLRTSSVTDYTVPAGTTQIGENAFDGSSIEKVTIPASVTHIARNAFRNCYDLTTVTFNQDEGEQLVIGKNAFENAGIQGTLALPARTAAIDDAAFYNCSDLESVTFGKGSILSSLGDSVFFNSGLENIALPASLVTMGDGVFRKTASLTTVTLPEGLTTMGNETFAESELTDITLPAGLRTIGTATFMDSSLQTIGFATGFRLTTLPVDTFKGSKLTTVTIPASFTQIAGETDENNSVTGGLFYGLSTLKTVTFEDGSKCLTIGAGAFCQTGITEIEIPASVTTIGREAFASSALTELDLPRTVVRVDDYAFYNCSALTTVSIGAGLNAIPANTFGNCSKLSEIELSASSPYFSLVGDVLFTKDESEIVLMPATLTEFTIPAGMTSADVFVRLAEIQSLKVVYVEAGNTAYKALEGAVYDAQDVLVFVPRAMTTFTIPDEIETLSVNTTQMFTNAAVQTVTYNQSRTKPLTIQSASFPSAGVFAYASALTTVTLPASATIGAYAFSGCSGLQSVTIGDGSTVHNGAFNNCAALTNVTFASANVTLQGNPFTRCAPVTTITVIGSTDYAKIVLEDKVLYDKDKTTVYLMQSDITSFEIPATLTDDSFIDLLKALSSLSSVTAEANGNYSVTDNVLYGSDGSIKLILPSATTLTIPENVTIDSNYISSLKELLEGTEVASIAIEAGNMSNYRALHGVLYDSSLAPVLIPAGMTTYTIPKDMTTLNDNDYFVGTNITKVTFEARTETLTISGTSESPFHDAPVEEVELPGTTVLGGYAFAYMTSLKKVTLNKGITKIGDSSSTYCVFSGCENLQTIVIPDSVTEIGYKAFENCTSLKSIDLTNIQTLDQSFQGWTSSQTIKVPFAEGGNAPDGWSPSWQSGCSAQIIYATEQETA